MVDLDRVPVAFNMDLANGRTSLRFCYEAAALLELSPKGDVMIELDTLDDDSEFLGDVVEEFNGRLANEGFAAFWNAGDVVVFDLRELSDEERDEFYEATENW